MLRKKYLNEAWMTLEVIPDEEKAVIQISQELLTPHFRSEVVKPSALYSSSPYEREVSAWHYEEIVEKNFHDILCHVSPLERKSVLIDLQPNLVELLGVAGTGKTTAVKKLTYTWATAGNQLLKNYDLIFFIPVRDIMNDKLIHILCDMHLLPNSEKKSFSHFLLRSEQARKILFILDGVDENDLLEGTDLFNLVTGRLYPNVTVLITARPEGKSLSFIDKKPRVKVTLHGVDEASVNRMLADAVTRSSEEEIETFKQRYKEKLSDKSLLFIPLYLTLLCFVFKEDIAKGIRCVDLKIPETMTGLFNAIMHVIIRRWLQKRKCNNLEIIFRNSSLEKGNNVPSEIKRILYFIGKLCYKGLLENKYQFSDQHAEEHYLDMEDIKQSGLFTVGRDNSGEIFFTKHKQLQEYLASLYLVCEGTKEPYFYKIMHKEENRNRTLIEVMTNCNLMKLTQFACGLSGDFLSSLLDVATCNFSLLCNKDRYDRYHEAINLHYEASLFSERNVPGSSGIDEQILEGHDSLTKYLCKAKIRYIDIDDRVLGVVSLEKYLQNMIRALDKDVCADLLNRFYDMKLRPLNFGQCARLAVQRDTCHYSCDTSEVRLNLDKLQTTLLSKVQIHNVMTVALKCLSAEMSMVFGTFVDTTGLLNTFPDLTELTICAGFCIFDSSAGKLLGDRNTKLKSFTIKCKNACSMPICHIQSLLKQSSLTKLQLSNVNILANLSQLNNLEECLWNGLQHVALQGVNDIFPHVSALSALLQASSGTLLSCELDIFVPKDSQIHMAVSLKCLGNLQELKLYASELPDYLAQVLAKCLPALKNLQKLVIRHLYVTSNVLTQLAGGIKTLVNLRYFGLCTWGDDMEDFMAQIAIDSLPCLPKINELDLRTHFVKPHSLEQLTNVLKSLHQLKRLNGQKVSLLWGKGNAIKIILSETLTSQKECNL